jgi:hypothetical protein
MGTRINPDLIHTGQVVQRIRAENVTASSASTVIPYDDTIPQNTEGTQILSLSITPKSATNKLRIRSCAWVDGSATYRVVIAVFRDSTANAMSSGTLRCPGAGSTMDLPVDAEAVAGSTSSTTFYIRMGIESGGTWGLNGTNGGVRYYGGSLVSFIEIEEVSA